MRRHKTVVDTCLAAALIVVALLVVRRLHPSADTRSPNGWNDALLVAVLAPIGVRRRYPIGAYIVTALAAVSLWSLNSIDGGSAIGGLFVTYGLGFYAERKRALPVFIISAASLSGAAVLLALIYDTEGRWFQCVSRIAVVLGPYFVGDSKRTRDELLQNLRERTLRADEDRARDARQAVVDERSRIAHELHDVVAHSLSVMVVQATAGQRLITRDPAGAAESLGSVAETGRAALAEMRRILGVLDSRPENEYGTQALAPQPGLGDIDSLLERCRGAGLPIDLQRSGKETSLSAGVELAIYRIVQEALTNVLKHAGTACVTLRLLIEDPIVVEVTDDGLGAAAPQPSDIGRGVIGMRARVESVGGEFHAGPRADGGFVVRAVIPRAARVMGEASISSGSAHR